MPKIHPQSGIALILFLVFFVLGITALLLSDFNNNTQFMLEDQAQTARALAQAKEALLGFAITYAKTHPGQPVGYLPCPDNDGDGSANPPCPTGTNTKGKTAVGRFPWRTLGLPQLRDGSGECLWYAVSGTYKDNTKQTLTSDSDGLLIVKNVKDETIAGTTEVDRAIAIIFAPGRALDGQNRGMTPGTETECGSTQNGSTLDEVNNLSNYLDNYSYNNVTLNNATGDGTLVLKKSGSGNSGFFTTENPFELSTFINAPLTRQNGTGKVIFNDTLMLITPKDFEPVYTQMDLWVAQKVGQCQINYSLRNQEKFSEQYKVALGDWTALTPQDLDNLVDGMDILPVGTYRQVYREKINLYVKLREAKFIANFHEKHVGETPMPILSASDIKEERTNAMINAIGVEIKFPWATLMDDVDDSAYTAKSGLRFGRIPDAPVSANDYIEQTWNTAQISGKICFDETSGHNNHEWGWWKEWKEMVFYAVDDDYTSDTTTYLWVKAVQTRSLAQNKWLDWVAWIAEPFDEVTQADLDQIEEVTGNDTHQIKMDTFAKTTEQFPVSETDWEHVTPMPSSHPNTLQLGNLVGSAPEGFDSVKFVVLMAGRRLLLNKGSSDSDYPTYQQIRSTLAEKKLLKNYLEGQAKPLDPLDTELNDPEPAPEKWRRLDQGGNFPDKGENDQIPNNSGDEIFIRKPIIPGYFNDIACKNRPSSHNPPHCKIPK